MSTLQIAPTVVSDPLPAHLRDGYEIHRAALRYGLDVTLYPRQVLMARHPDGGPELAFIHGIPQSSTLAAVTYAQDKHMRRELLARAGLPVPEGATFAMRDADQARSFAQTIGYPVVVKPAVGNNTTEVLHAADEAALERAIQYLQIPEEQRPTFTRAAYGLTLLQELREEDGKAVAPASYSFLVERRVAGQYLRFLVLADEVISVVHCRHGQPGSPDGSNVDVGDRVHPSLADVAVRAAHTLPGLTVVAVDIVVGDYTRPVGEQQAWIVETSERPWLVVQANVSAQHAEECAERILRYSATSHACRLDDPADEVRVSFHAEGLVRPDAAVDAIVAASAELGLEATAQVADQVEGTISGHLRGTPGAVAKICELLVGPGVNGQRAMLVEARQSGSHERDR